MVVQISIKDDFTQKRIRYDEFDFHKGIVSFMFKETKDEIDQLVVQGICMKKFKGDILISNVDLEFIVKEAYFTIGNTLFQITEVGKTCHSLICPIYDENKMCCIQKGVMFANVIKEGRIKIGDTLNKIEPRWKVK